MGFHYKYLFIALLLLMSCSRDLSKQDVADQLYYKSTENYGFMDTFKDNHTYSSYFNLRDIDFRFHHTEQGWAGNAYVFISVNMEKNDTFRVFVDKNLLPARFNAINHTTYWEGTLNGLPGKKIIMNADICNHYYFKCRREGQELEMLLSFTAIMTLNGSPVPYDFSLKLVLEE